MTDFGQLDQPAGPVEGKGCVLLGGVGFAVVLCVLAAIVLAAIVLLGAILFSLPPKGGPDPTQHPAVGSLLPQLELEPLVGADRPVAISDLAGKVVVVNFWATWCQPCWSELPHMAALHQKYSSRPDFLLLSVSCGYDFPEDVDLLRRDTADFMEKSQLRLPTYADPKATTRRAFDSLAPLVGLPTTFVLDRHGVVRGVWEGYGPKVPEQIEELVVRLLGFTARPEAL